MMNKLKTISPVMVVVTLAACASPNNGVSPKSSDRYESHYGDSARVLEFSRRGPERIVFKLTSEDQNKKVMVIEGEAERQDGDPEVIDGNDGAHPAENFIQDEKCWVSISVQLNRGERARVVTLGCNESSELSRGDEVLIKKSG